MTNKFFYNISIVLACCFFFSEAQAQRFNFSPLVGLNLAQINGDNFAGYDRLGLLAGVRTNILLTDRFDAVIELLYSERGSSSEVTFGGSNAEFAVRLNYVEIPLLIEVKDWLIEDTKEKYHRIRFHGGISYGRLFQVEEDELSNFGLGFKENDFSFVLGATFYATRSLGINLRYTRTFISLEKVDLGRGSVNVIPHHLSIFANYMF